jgi:hypothetical protein
MVSCGVLDFPKFQSIEINRWKSQNSCILTGMNMDERGFGPMHMKLEARLWLPSLPFQN